VIYVGIDPGVSGGIAWTGPEGAKAERMPEAEADVVRLLAAHAQEAVAVIERVASSPQMGVTSAFTFGRTYGFLRGCLVTLGIPFMEVAPLKWQRALECLSPAKPSGVVLSAAQKSERQREHKNQTKARAQQLFPHLQVTHAIGDALLLATYCARQDWRGIGR
jgi:hypothetical protein